MSSKYIKKRAVALAAILMLVTPAFAFVGSGVTFDPIAKAQRAIMMIEQKIQTLQAIQMLRQMIANVKAANMIYEMGKKSWEQMQDKDTWQALGQFGKKRMEAIFDPDPYEAPLWKMFKSADRVLDNYTDSITELGWLIDNDYVQAADSWFVNTAKAGGIINPVNWQDATAQAQVSQWEARYFQDVSKQAQKTYVQKATKTAEILRKEKENLGEEQDKIKREEDEVNQAFAKIYDSKMSASFSLQSLTGAGESQAAFNRVTLTDMQLKDIERRRVEIDKRRRAFEEQLKDLLSRMETAQSNLQEVRQSFSIARFLKMAWVKLSISSLSSVSNVVEQVEVGCLKLLVITFALALLWYGIHAYRGAEAEIPHDVVLGLIAAFLFLSPISPLAFHKLTKDMAIVVDGLTATFSQNVGDPIANVTAMISLSNDAILEKKSKEGTDFSTTLGGVKMAFDRDVLASTLRESIFSAVAYLLSFAGAASVLISLMMRNLVFWVLMALGPLFIVMAPLPYARKNLLPRWGAVIYGTILWGPVIYILLTVANFMFIQFIGIDTSMKNAMFYAFFGLVLIVAMILSPVLVFQLAQGSFGAVTGALAAAAVSAGTAGSTATMAGSGLAMRSAGGTMTAVGGLVNSWGGKLAGGMGHQPGFRPPQTFASGLSRGMGRVGGYMQKFGTGVSTAGKGLTQAGSYVSNVGSSVRSRRSLRKESEGAPN